MCGCSVVLACSALAMLREQVTDDELSTSSTLLSQERLICRAAGLSHFLSNEVIVALVSFMCHITEH